MSVVDRDWIKLKTAVNCHVFDWRELHTARKMPEKTKGRDGAPPVSYWSPGDNGMAERIRAFDWASTPLGRIVCWPDRLRDAVAFMLTGSLPSFIVWGAEWTLLHNDAMAHILADIHPDSLGLPVFEALPASQANWESELHRAMSGESVRLAETRFDLTDGETLRELWIDGQASPLSDETGAVAGALVIFADVTAHVQARRQRDVIEAEFHRSQAHHAFLLTLSDALRPLAHAGEIKRAAARILGAHLKVNRATYFETSTNDYIVEEDYANSVTPLCGAYAIASFGPVVFETLQAGATAMKSDVMSDPRLSTAEKTAFEAIDVAAYIAVPLLKEGQLIAGLAVQSASKREWTAEEIALVEETGERTWAAVERARAEAALSANEERLRLAQKAGQVGVFDWNIFTNEVIWTPELADVFGLPLGKFENNYEGWSKHVLPEDLSRLETLFTAWLQSSQDEKQWDYRCLRHGEVRWMSARGRLFRDRAGKPLRMIGTCSDITERKRTENALRESLDRLAAALHAGRLGVYDYNPRTGTAKWDRETYRLWGVPESEPVTYETFEAGVHPEDRDAVRAVIQNSLDPSGARHYECEFRVINRADQMVRWIFADADVTFEDGHATRIVGTVQDVTEKRRAQERIELLLREVNHRTKNMLSIVQAIARQTLAARPDQFIDRFEERLQALTASQDLLIRSAWKGVVLAELIESQLAYFRHLIPIRIKFSGPPFLISAPAAQTLGMALHELATNASKYGALSNDRGCISITWSLEAVTTEREADFVINWKEYGGPPVVAPSRRGFGTTIISYMTETNLDGKVDLAFATEGLTWRLRCPASRVLEIGHPRHRADSP